MLRSKFLLLIVLLIATVTNGQNFLFGSKSMGEVKGTISLEPKDVIVGIPCNFVLKFDTPNAIKLTGVSGIPQEDVEFLSKTFEPYNDKSYKLAVRFLKPVTNKIVKVSLRGMQVKEHKSSMGFSSVMQTSFETELPEFKMNVMELPTERKPLNFSGAVGTKYTLTQKLEPDHVHPGDLVTATYTLKFDGYCPSNLVPRVDRLSKEFKSYEPKEISRKDDSITWTHVLVPRTTSATNSALVSVTYYNPYVKRYEIAQASPKSLTFVSDQAASTENTSVMITSGNSTETGTASVEQDRNTEGAALNVPVQLRFAPSDSAAIIAVLPPGTSLKELSRHNNWRRVETSRAIGWVKSQTIQ